MSTEINSTTTKTSWVKQAYFYIVMIGCIIAFSISTITLLQKTLTRYVFPKANYDWGSMYSMGYTVETACQNELLSPIYPARMMAPGEQPSTPPPVSQDKIDKCIAEKKQQEADRKEADFQNGVLYSVLTLLITLAVFYIHIKYVKPKI
jgi:hypothetical protein